MHHPEPKDSPRNIAVIVAGGKGLRMQSDIKKQYLLLDGIPVLARTLAAFYGHPRIHNTILVAPKADLGFCREKIIPGAALGSVELVAGGITRQESVFNGLARAQIISAQDSSPPMVLVHDGVRPFVSENVIMNCLEKAGETGACIPVTEITDTIKQVDAGSRVTKTLDRSKLFRAQTPQVFRLDLLTSAYTHAEHTRFTGTDEASVLEHAGMAVETVAGDPFNIKLTTPADLAMAEFILKMHASRFSR